VAALEGAAIDGPAGGIVTVVNLFESDAGSEDGFFHGGGVGQGSARTGVERFDEDAPATRGQAGADEGVGVVEGEQAGFEGDSAREKEFAEFDNAGFTLIDGDEVGKLLPRGDDAEALAWVSNDGCRGGEGDRDSWTECAYGAKSLGAGGAVEGLAARFIKGVHMDRVGAGVDRGARGLGYCRRSARGRGVNSVSIESGLEEYGIVHRAGV